VSRYLPWRAAAGLRQSLHPAAHNNDAAAVDRVLRVAVVHGDA
jgi:hypothetical protein